MTTQLRDTTNQLRDRLTAMGVPLPLELKRRDPKEPGRKQKEATEEALRAAFLTYFLRQRKYIKDTLEKLMPERKALDYDIDYLMGQFDDLPGGDAFIAKIARLLVSASAAGIDIFAELINLQIDYTMVNTAAAKWAIEHAGEMITGQVEKTTIEAVRRAMSDFVSTPGMKIGDIINVLEPTFGERRALLIAINETTDTYANADKLAGEELQKEYPEVLVAKQAFTNQDDVVCPICRPFNGKVVPINEMFVHPETGERYDGPKFHIGCRCWRSTTTRIDGVILPEEYGGVR